MLHPTGFNSFAAPPLQVKDPVSGAAKSKCRETRNLIDVLFFTARFPAKKCQVDCAEKWQTLSVFHAGFGFPLQAFAPRDIENS
ncbi:MAG TPA: hypothetical protein VGG85_18725 [Terracidiphilus sp.]